MNKCIDKADIPARPTFSELKKFSVSERAAIMA